VLVLHERKSRVTLAARLAGKTAEIISVMLAVFARVAPALRKFHHFRPACCRIKGSAPVGDHRRRQMGPDHHPCRSPLPAIIVTAERKFWRCVETGEPPRLFGVEPPKPRIEAVRIVDMSGSNAWAEFAAFFNYRWRNRTPGPAAVFVDDLWPQSVRSASSPIRAGSGARMRGQR
jgi:hypothetical protein